MAGLPRKYAKMGFKRGWAAYNRSKKPRRKSKSRTQVKHMARRKRFSFRKAYRKAKKGFTLGNITKILVGAGLAAMYEIYLSPMLPIGNGMMKNIVEFFVGVMLMVYGRWMPVKAFGAALATINAYSLIAGFIPSGGVSQTSDW